MDLKYGLFFFHFCFILFFISFMIFLLCGGVPFRRKLASFTRFFYCFNKIFFSSGLDRRVNLFLINLIVIMYFQYYFL